jgi:hypothetical protein
VSRHLRRWGAVYILAALWLGSSALYFWAELFAQIHEAHEHGQAMEWPQFWAAFWSGYFENLQSEWAQLAVQAVLIVGFAHVVFRKGEEDNARLERKVDELSARAVLASAYHVQLERRIDDLGVKVAAQKGCRFPVWR